MQYFSTGYAGQTAEKLLVTIDRNSLFPTRICVDVVLKVNFTVTRFFKSLY